jgi:hypothetical protein
MESSDYPDAIGASGEFLGDASMKLLGNVAGDEGEEAYPNVGIQASIVRFF